MSAGDPPDTTPSSTTPDAAGFWSVVTCCHQGDLPPPRPRPLTPSPIPAVHHTAATTVTGSTTTGTSAANTNTTTPPLPPPPPTTDSAANGTNGRGWSRLNDEANDQGWRPADSAAPQLHFQTRRFDGASVLFFKPLGEHHLPVLFRGAGSSPLPLPSCWCLPRVQPGHLSFSGPWVASFMLPTSSLPKLPEKIDGPCTAWNHVLHLAVCESPWPSDAPW